MELLKFTISGSHAFFKKPEVNSYYYFSFGQIHKPAVLGILGSVLGYGGYAKMRPEDSYPEYYERLQSVQLSIRPNAPKGYFRKSISSYNNSVGYASREQGGNLIVKEQWLEEPSWDIYIMMNHPEAEKAAAAMTRQECAFIPYLGRNNHTADLTEIKLLEGTAEPEPKELNCLFMAGQAALDLENWETPAPFKYEESLPYRLQEETHLYEYRRFFYSNIPIKEVSAPVWRAEEKNMIFY